MQAERAEESLSNNSAQRNGMEKKHSPYFLPSPSSHNIFLWARFFFSPNSKREEKESHSRSLLLATTSISRSCLAEAGIFFPVDGGSDPSSLRKKIGRGWVCRPSGSSSNRLGGGPQAVTDDRSQDETSPSSFLLSSSLAELFPVFSVCVGSPPLPLSWSSPYPAQSLSSQRD